MKLICKTSCSMTFECDNKAIYYAPEAYDVYLNDQQIQSNVKTNIFSLFDLEPNHVYEIRVNNDVMAVRTDDVSEILYIKDFGAVGDGIHDDTNAFQQAINQAKPNVLITITEGTYKIRPVFLKSHQTINIKKNAVLLAETDRHFYPILPGQITHRNGNLIEFSSWEGEVANTFASVLTGLGVNDVNIVGEGLIDGHASASDWWKNHKVMRGGAWRPKGLFFSNCEHILLQGITIQNTPSWSIHPYFCRYFDMVDIRVINPKTSPNTDGFDPEATQHINVIGVQFTVGDDCIAVKSNKYELGMKYRKATSNMVIRNCLMNFGHGAVVLGSEASAGIKNLTVSQCYFKETDRGLRIKTRRGRGESSVIDEITFENIYMDHVLVPLVINMYYYCDIDGHDEYVWSKAYHEIDQRTPYLGSFKFKDIDAVGVHAAAGFFYGLPEQPIKSVTLEHVTFTYAEHPKPFLPAMMDHEAMQIAQGLQFHYVDEVILKDVTIHGAKGEPVTLDHVKSFKKI